MATTSQNNQYRAGIKPAWPLPIDFNVNGGAINAGDMCYWTGAGVASYGSGPLALSTAEEALIQAFVGVSKDQNPLVGGISSPILYAGIQTDGTYSFNTTSGDTYAQFSPVTIGADAQTITLAPTPAAPGGTAVASGTGGTFSAGAHSVRYTYLTADGESAPGPATSLTLTSGQNIVVTLASIPSYATAVGVYVDGVFVGFVTSTAATTFTGPASGSAAAKLLPVTSGLAIGYVDLPTGATAISPNISGGSGVTVPVRIKPGYLTAGL